MYEHTTTSIAEYLGVSRPIINAHIKSGNLKAKYKAKLNDVARYYISYKEFLRFCDWFLYDKGKNVGVAYKKTPNVDEYDLKPKKFNCYVSLKIQRNKSILECKHLNKKKSKLIALDFNLGVKSIDNIIAQNKETKFVKKLISQYNNSIVKIIPKIKETPNIDEYEKNNKVYFDKVSIVIERNKEILQLKYLNNYSAKIIAKKYSLSVYTIYKIIKQNKETKFVKELKKMSDVFK